MSSPSENSGTDDEVGSVSDDGRPEISTDANGAARPEVHPISYGTNWMPQPNFTAFKEAQRNLSMKSFHNVNDIQVTGSKSSLSLYSLNVSPDATSSLVACRIRISSRRSHFDIGAVTTSCRAIPAISRAVVEGTSTRLSSGVFSSSHRSGAITG